MLCSYPPFQVRTDSVVSEATASDGEQEQEASDDPQDSEDSDYEGALDPEKERRLVAEWKARLGPGFQVIVAQLGKFKANGGLGISLEGTVEKVDGAEQNPHHYIREELKYLQTPELKRAALINRWILIVFNHGQAVAFKCCL